MKHYAKLMLLSIAAGVLFFTSCVNEDYDLRKGITAETTLFENIAAPIGNVEKITLDKLLFSKDASDLGILYTEDGDLYIDFAGGYFSAEILVPDFSLPGIELPSQKIMFNIPKEITSLPAELLHNFFPVVKYSDVEPGGVEFSMNLKFDTDLPDGIDSVSEVYMDSSLECLFKVNNGIMYVSEGFEFIFPEFLQISSEDTSDVYEVTDANKVIFKTDTVLSSGSPISLSISLDCLDIPENAVITGADGSRKIVLDGSVDVKGDFYIKSKDYQTIPESLALSIDVMSGDIKVTEALASLDLGVELPDEDIIVGESPELFGGDDVCIDLYNPIISLAIENGSPFGFSLDADITAYNSTGAHDVHIGSYGNHDKNYVLVPASESKEYHFSRRAMSSVPAGSANIVLPALGELIQEVPERLSIHDLDVAVENGQAKVKTGSEYAVSMSYGFSSPLAFGEKLNLVFTQNIENLNLQLGVNIKSAQVSMELLNSIPVDFDIQAICLDEFGNNDSQTKVYVDKTIAAGSHTSPVSTPVVIKIENLGAEVNISSLKLTLTATSVNPEFHGVCLNRNQGLEINNIVLRLPDGIGVELNN